MYELLLNVKDNKTQRVIFIIEFLAKINEFHDCLHVDFDSTADFTQACYISFGHR